MILVNNPKQPLLARNSSKYKIFWKRIIKNPLKSQLYFFFLTQSLLMDKVIKNKRGLELVSLQVVKQVHKNFFISYILSDQVWWCNIKQLMSYFKNYSCKFKLFRWNKNTFHTFWRVIFWWKNENLIKNSGHKL